MKLVLFCGFVFSKEVVLRELTKFFLRTSWDEESFWSLCEFWGTFYWGLRDWLTAFSLL